MNWDAIAAVGDIIGAIAVVISLVYLAVQIRISNKATQQAVSQELMETAWQTLSQLSTNPTLAKLWVKGSANEKLTLPESVQYRTFLLQLLNLWERTYRLSEEGNPDHWLQKSQSAVR